MLAQAGSVSAVNLTCRLKTVLSRVGSFLQLTADFHSQLHNLSDQFLSKEWMLWLYIWRERAKLSCTYVKWINEARRVLVCFSRRNSRFWPHMTELELACSFTHVVDNGCVKLASFLVRSTEVHGLWNKLDGRVSGWVFFIQTISHDWEGLRTSNLAQMWHLVKCKAGAHNWISEESFCNYNTRTVAPHMLLQRI